MYFVDAKRAEELGSLLREYGELIDLLEKGDPQFKAVVKLVESLGCSYASVIVVGNALISYQLTSRGEEYWEALSSWFKNSTDKIKDLENLYILHELFVTNTRYNRIGVTYKIKRLRKYYSSPIAFLLFNDPLIFCDRLDSLVDQLASQLYTNAESKTIVFSGKMYHYVCKACSKESKGSLPIPVDRRNAFLSISSCLIKGCTKQINQCVKDLMSTKHRRLVVNAWSIVSEASGIPSHRLDSLTWILAGYIKSRRPIHEIKSDICRSYGYCSEKIVKLLRELTRCMV